MCEEQTSGALGHLQADPDWRKEYLELWMHQRPPPFRITFDDYDFDGMPTCHAAAVLRCAVSAFVLLLLPLLLVHEADVPFADATSLLHKRMSTVRQGGAFFSDSQQVWEWYKSMLWSGDAKTMVYPGSLNVRQTVLCYLWQLTALFATYG